MHKREDDLPLTSRDIWNSVVREKGEAYNAALREVEKAYDSKEIDDIEIGEDIKLDSSILTEAHSIVSRRNDAYGEPTDTAERVASAFNSLTKRIIRPADVALIQILFKIVRSEHGYKRDNNVDLAGYADIRERCLLKEIEEEQDS